MREDIFKIKSVVIEGRKNGRRLGVPTANINIIDHVNELPEFGVYAGYINVRKKRYRCVLSIGRAVTFDAKEVTLEVHVLDFCRDIYGLEVEIELIRKLRNMIKFDSEEDLKAQMKKDCEEARGIL